MSELGFCTSCGKHIASHIKRFHELKNEVLSTIDEDITLSNITSDDMMITVSTRQSNGIIRPTMMTIDNYILDRMGIERYCCRKNIMCSVDMTDIIH